jgi:hypothetical protein
VGAQHLLDQVQSLAKIEALEAAPVTYAAELGNELSPAASFSELEARDAQLSAALAAIDALTARAMRVLLEHALADDASLGSPTRAVFCQTVITYEGKLDLLSQRTRDLAARGGSRVPDDIADRVTAAARRVLALRDALAAGVLALIKDLATAAIPEADRQARDKRLDDALRKRWSAVRRDLEVLAEEPGRIAVAPMPARVASWPEQIDDPAPEKEVTFADMIELD